MQLLGRDADFRAKTKFSAIRIPGGCIHINRCRVHLIEKLLRSTVILRYNAFTVPGPYLLSVYFLLPL